MFATVEIKQILGQFIQAVEKSKQNFQDRGTEEEYYLLDQSAKVVVVKINSVSKEGKQINKWMCSTHNSIEILYSDTESQIKAQAVMLMLPN